MWFNSPFSKNGSTKIGKSFLSLLDLHFPKNLIYNNIFNRRKIEVSYGCMLNTKSINNHNKEVLSNSTETEESCNSRNRSDCPVHGKCLTWNMKHRSHWTSSTTTEKFTYELSKQISNTDLETTQNHSTLNTMKITLNYLKNIRQ